MCFGKEIKRENIGKIAKGEEVNKTGRGS